MNNGYKLIHVIIAKNKASKVLKEAKKYGAKGGTIFLATGTIKNKLLNFLSIYDQDKELVIIAADTKTSNKVVPHLVDKFNMEKPNTGIVFTTNIASVLGAAEKVEFEKEEVINPMFKLITTIVDRGKADEVVDAANAAGARGGTVLHARGSGSKETLKLFNMEIEPEKEVVKIIVESKIAKEVIERINKDLNIEKPGMGIIFTQDIDEAYGIYGSENVENI